MAIAKFGRVITAMITPFKENGDVNYEGASSLSKYLVNHGSEGILVGGTTGEGATMSSEEKLKLYKMIVDAVGKNGTEKKRFDRFCQRRLNYICNSWAYSVRNHK